VIDGVASVCLSDDREPRELGFSCTCMQGAPLERRVVSGICTRERVETGRVDQPACSLGLRLRENRWCGKIENIHDININIVHSIDRRTRRTRKTYCVCRCRCRGECACKQTNDSWPWVVDSDHLMRLNTCYQQPLGIPCDWATGLGPS
jgi:hypothetical protein